MEPERWSQVNELVGRALERPPEEWAAFLAACDDAEIRREAESLLAVDAAALSALERPPLPLVDRTPEIEPGERIGAYRVVRELGRGGMGVVYLAERADQEFERRVAVKVLKRGLDTAEIVRRFRTERQILANLKHPGIAGLYEGGTTDDGRPYFVLEHVEGEPLLSYCDTRRLGVDDRLALFLRVAEAVQLAHQNLVVHRDLKPANILVTAEGQPKLLDFGIAKLIDPDTGEGLPQTVLGTRPMTPAYASPEQIRGEPVTTATDVYALGLLLYELLTGRNPYRIERIDRIDRAGRTDRSLQSFGEGGFQAGTRPTVDEITRAICETDPVRPSVAVVRPRGLTDCGASTAGRPPEELSRDRGEEPRRLARLLSGDLDNIVLKAMEKDPGRRYPSVEQLAADVGRHLEGLPVHARKPTLVYRLHKLVRRRSRELAVATVAVASLAGFLVDRELQQRQTSRALSRAERVTELLVELFEVSDPGEARGNSITAREVLDRGAERVRTEMAEEPEVQAALMHTIGTVYFSLGLYDAAEPLLRDALTLRRQVLGEHHPDVARTLSSLGSLLRDRGEYPEAEATLREALALERAVSGEESLRAAEYAHRLALVLQVRGEADEADALYREVLELRRRLLGDEHPETVESLNDLAVELYRQGKDDEAERRFREVLELRRHLFGGVHPDVAKSANNLAFFLESRGGDGVEDEVEALYRSALDLHRRSLGEDHPDVATSIATLGRFLRDRGDYEGAEPLLRDALARHRSLLGGEHPAVASDRRELAILLERTGRLAEAEEEHREALTIARAAHGEEHLSVAIQLNNLGAVLVAEGKLQEAEEVLTRSLALYRSLLGPDGAGGTSPLHHLGTLHRLRGEPEAAESFYREALEIRRKAHPGPHPRVAVSLLHLGRLLVDTGRAEEAEEVARDARSILRECPRSDIRLTAQSEAVLGAALVGRGRYAEAEPLLTRSYPVLRDRLSDRSLQTREARATLAALYRGWGRPAEARRYEVPLGGAPTP